MGSYANKRPMAPEVNHSGVPFPQNNSHPGNFFPAENVDFQDSQASKMNSSPGIAAVPIHSVAPASQTQKNKLATHPMKAKKKRSPSKDSLQTTSENLRAKQPKKKPPSAVMFKEGIKLRENFFAAENVDFHDSQASQVNSSPGIAAVPIFSVAPTSGTPKNKFAAHSMKAKKKSSPSKDSHQTVSENLIAKQPKKKPPSAVKFKEGIKLREKVEKKNPNEVNEANIDFSRVPPPICSCTGVARGCYRCGTCGWQSSCCTRTLSAYPLPMSPSKPGARLSGRKMTIGAYRKLLCRVAAEGNDLSHPVDLKNHWAKHGTNKFVTIK